MASLWDRIKSAARRSFGDTIDTENWQQAKQKGNLTYSQHARYLNALSRDAQTIGGLSSQLATAIRRKDIARLVVLFSTAKQMQGFLQNKYGRDPVVQSINVLSSKANSLIFQLQYMMDRTATAMRTVGIPKQKGEIYRAGPTSAQRLAEEKREFRGSWGPKGGFNKYISPLIHRLVK